ncbi:MAG: DUF58 domain-containing protein [Acidimicrobiia bacterium]|nr:DUF58 domain-containing protein [Acidimicrobiia bacterium]
MPVPTARLAVVAAVAAVVVFLADSPVGLLLVNSLLVAAVMVEWVRTVPPGRLGVRRHVAEVVPLGGTATVAWEVTNPTGHSVRVDIADELAPSLGASTRRASFDLAAATSARREATLRPTRRGRFDPAEVVVRTTSPWGLLARQQTFELPNTLRVYPSFRSRQEAELRIDRARILDVGLRSAKGRGGGTEFDQLREYTPDDEFRRIDWAATARSTSTIVRTYRAERNQTVINLLDNGRVMASTVGGAPRVEHAMDAVMMLTTVATRLGDRAGLVAFDHEIRAVVTPGHGTGQLARVTDAMVELEPSLAESDYRSAFTTTLARFRRRALLVIHTDLVEQAVSELLVPALSVVARSHLVLVSSTVDPDVVRWAGAEVTDRESAYRRAAAIAAIDERRRATARLRALGATVVDAPPATMAARLSDAYLQLKAVGGL